MCGKDIQKHLCFLFLLFFKENLNVLPLICLIYRPLDIAKKRYRVRNRRCAPWQIASSTQIVAVAAMRFEALCWEEKGCLDVSRAPPLIEDPHRSVTVCFPWLNRWDGDRAILWRRSTLLPSNHSTVKNNKNKTEDTEQRLPSAQSSRCFKDAQP